MLMISRKPGQSFWISSDTEVIVMGCQGNSIKIGVRAPRNVLILRDELRTVAQQNQAAIGTFSETSLANLAAHLQSSES